MILNLNLDLNNETNYSSVRKSLTNIISPYVINQKKICKQKLKKCVIVKVSNKS